MESVFSVSLATLALRFIGRMWPGVRGGGVCRLRGGI